MIANTGPRRPGPAPMGPTGDADELADKEFWLAMRRAFLAMAKAIERRYGTESEPERDRPRILAG